MLIRTEIPSFNEFRLEMLVALGNTKRKLRRSLAGGAFILLMIANQKCITDQLYFRTHKKACFLFKDVALEVATISNMHTCLCQLQRPCRKEMCREICTDCDLLTRVKIDSETCL